jgi:hypothetical protein
LHWYYLFLLFPAPTTFFGVFTAFSTGSGGFNTAAVNGLTRSAAAFAFARAVFRFLFARVLGVSGSPIAFVRTRLLLLLRSDARVPGEVGGFGMTNVEMKC